MVRFVLGSGLLLRDTTLLLVRSRYDGEPLPLWTLPGGRQELGETIAQTVAREYLEETSLQVRLSELAYVSESVDAPAGLHVVNCTFWVSESDATIQPGSNDPKVLETQFVPIEEAPNLLRADVLRIPVAAALRDRLGSRDALRGPSGSLGPHYYSFDANTIVVPFFHSGRSNG